ncbi:SANT/Myb_domain [Hexamita inflata]|uniref:SANT/Myb domain n=1 Tax=Hexamita inflata TaxID=28002 RepID=A0AA86TXM9_9EUKA|nr:SANT/Myb domain [Hexamita inflata]
MRTQLKELLLDNCVKLQEIHSVMHNINQLSLTVRKYMHVKWSDQEDQLMDVALLLFGKNYSAISKIVVSKTPAQVYQRLRYLKGKEYFLQTQQQYE